MKFTSTFLYKFRFLAIIAVLPLLSIMRAFSKIALMRFIYNLILIPLSLKRDKDRSIQLFNNK